MQSNSPVPNQLYTISNATTSSGPLITILKTVDPTTNDINYSVKQRWINTENKTEWILTGFTVTNGVTTANWLRFNGGSLIEFTGGTGTSGSFPVTPNIAGQIELQSSDSSVIIEGGTNSLNLKVTNNGVLQFTGGTGTTGFPVSPNGSGEVQLKSLDQSILFTGSTNSIDAKVNFKVVTTAYTSSGDYTPTTGMRYCVVEVIGAGGGGGGVHATLSGQIGGGGGGSGAYTRGVFSSTDITVPTPYVVGTGGAGGVGSSGSSGSPGGESSFGTTLLISGGGLGGGGQSGDSAAGIQLGGGGGAPSGTNIAVSSSGWQGGNALWADVGGSVLFLQSGKGADSIYGSGGLCSGVSGGGGGSDGTAGSQGGGGSGAFQSGSAVDHSGGAGGNGLIIITEYIFYP